MKDKYLVEIFIEGKVQKVGYRKYIQEKAKEYHISGFAKNLKNGKVQIHLISENEAKIKKMLELCKKGSDRAEIEKAEIKWEKVDIKENFYIL